MKRYVFCGFPAFPNRCWNVTTDLSYASSSASSTGLSNEAWPRWNGGSEELRRPEDPLDPDQFAEKPPGWCFRDHRGQNGPKNQHEPQKNTKKTRWSHTREAKVTVKKKQQMYLSSWELTYFLPRHFWVNDFLFLRLVGYVSSLEGRSFKIWDFQYLPDERWEFKVVNVAHTNRGSPEFLVGARLT